MPIPLSSESLSRLVSSLRSAGCVFAEEEARLLTAEAGSEAELYAMAERRARGLPLEHVLGWAEFRGLRVEVDSGVFVPRRRTEFLVERAIAAASAVRERPVLVDLCCGSGAVGAALISALEGARLYAADIDPAAAACARRNIAARGGLAERVFQGDLYGPLPGALMGQVDVLVANVPYVPTEAVGLLPAEAREYEPRVALDGGTDGLEVLRRVAAGAARWLAPGGTVLTETSERQAPRASDVMAGGGLAPRVWADEERGATVVTGTRAE
jgi:release factor glutamine methyltransferase